MVFNREKSHLDILEGSLLLFARHAAIRCVLHAAMHTTILTCGASGGPIAFPETPGGHHLDILEAPGGSLLLGARHAAVRRAF